MQKYVRFADDSGTSNIRLLAYYLQRMVTSRRLRCLFDRVVRCVLRCVLPSKQKLPDGTGDASVLRDVGLMQLGRILTDEQCTAIRGFLFGKTLTDSRGTGAQFDFSQRPPGVKLGDYDLHTVVNCPHAMEVANSSHLLALAEDFLGFIPTITNISLRWSFPAASPAGEVQSFHRDAEVGASFKILIYLTEVDSFSGPHVYVPGTHRDRMPFRLRIYSDDEIARKYSSNIVITGPAGTGFGIDTRGIHKGTPPVTRPRLMLTIQYALMPCLLYSYSPVAQKQVKFDRYINRLILREESAEL